MVNRQKIDWVITLLPMISISGLSALFFIMPEESNRLLSSIRFFFGDTMGTYYLVIGLGIFFISLYFCCSHYGNIVLGDKKEKPRYSFFTWGSMMFTCGLAADILKHIAHDLGITEAQIHNIKAIKNENNAAIGFIFECGKKYKYVYETQKLEEVNW